MISNMPIGDYIPVQQPMSDSDHQSLTDATRHLHELLEAKGIDPEARIQDVKALRKAHKQRRG